MNFDEYDIRRSPGVQRNIRVLEVNFGITSTKLNSSASEMEFEIKKQQESFIDNEDINNLNTLKNELYSGERGTKYSQTNTKTYSKDNQIEYLGNQFTISDKKPLDRNKRLITDDISAIEHILNETEGTSFVDLGKLNSERATLDKPVIEKNVRKEDYSKISYDPSFIYSLKNTKASSEKQLSKEAESHISEFSIVDKVYTDNDNGKEKDFNKNSKEKDKNCQENDIRNIKPEGKNKEDNITKIEAKNNPLTSSKEKGKENNAHDEEDINKKKEVENIQKEDEEVHEEEGKRKQKNVEKNIITKVEQHKGNIEKGNNDKNKEKNIEEQVKNENEFNKEEKEVKNEAQVNESNEIKNKEMEKEETENKTVNEPQNDKMNNQDNTDKKISNQEDFKQNEENNFEKKDKEEENCPIEKVKVKGKNKENNIQEEDPNNIKKDEAY